jgi:hypothetical protein
VEGDQSTIAFLSVRTSPARSRFFGRDVVQGEEAAAYGFDFDFVFAKGHDFEVTARGAERITVHPKLSLSRESSPEAVRVPAANGGAPSVPKRRAGQPLAKC